MARTKSLIVKIFVAVMALVATSCADALHNEMAPQSVKVTPFGEPEDSTHVTLRDSTGRILVTGYELGKYAEVRVERTLYADAKEAWKPAERLVKNVAETAETAFRYNHGVNTVGSKVVLVVKQDYFKDFGDGRVIRLKKGDIIPLWKPENLNLRGGEPVTEVREGKLFYAETAVNYSLRYSEVVLAEGIQNFVAEEGYVPSFEAMFWNSNHNLGTAKATYANAKVTIECTDSLRAWERWDDASLKNWLRTIYHSQNVFSTTISGTEVTSFSAVLNKDMSISGNKATIAEFSVEFNLSSKTIKESRINYTYNSKSINFVDSLTACGYSLKGAKLTSKTNLHVVFTHEGDDVNVDIPVNITEKVRLVRTDSTFVHVNYVSTVTPNGTNLPVLSNHTVTFENVYSNGTKSVAGKVNYLWTNNYSISYDSNMMVDDLNSVLGRHTVNSNGSVTVAGYNFTVSFVNRVCDDIMYNGKNYKSYAPVCKAKVVAITINKTSLVVEFQGDHDGDNSVIKATLPLTVTEKLHDPDFPGHIVWGGATDSYVDGANVATWEGTYMHFIVENNGAYKVYSRKVGTNGWSSTDVSAAYVATITNSRAVAYIGNTAAGYSLGSCQWQDQGNWTKIVYFNYNGGVARVISEISKTIGGESSNNCRMPLRGTWANGKITVDGTTYTVTGSED